VCVRVLVSSERVRERAREWQLHFISFPESYSQHSRILQSSLRKK
jgi:hypothetical protein